MQNEPNFQNGRINVTSVMTNRYEKKGHLVNGKNEPKTNPNEPNFLRNWPTVTYGKLEGYKMNLDFWPKIPKPNSNPNLLGKLLSAYLVIIKSYVTDLDFWLKNPKAKTNPISETIKNEHKYCKYNEL